MGETGRPSLYTRELAELICERLADGQSLRAICRVEGMPADRTVRRWATDNVDGFGERYSAAREAGYHAIAEEMLEIADDGRNDSYVDESGNPRTDNDVVQRSRLRVDTRKWYLAKMLPKVYGDRQAVEHSGGLTLEQLVNQALALVPRDDGEGG